MKRKIIEKLRCSLEKYFETSDCIEKLMCMCRVDAYLELVSISELPKDLAKKVVFYNVSVKCVSPLY